MHCIAMYSDSLDSVKPAAFPPLQRRVCSPRWAALDLDFSRMAWGTWDERAKRFQSERLVLFEAERSSATHLLSPSLSLPCC